MYNFYEILKHFSIKGIIKQVIPLGHGLINDTFKVEIQDTNSTDYVLQRINSEIFEDVEGLQHNVVATTFHIKNKLVEAGTSDVDRKVLTFVPTIYGKSYYYDGKDYWRVSLFIPKSVTYDLVNPYYSYLAGKAFGQFQSMLSDINVKLVETIPGFHNMELRLRQFKEAVDADVAARKSEVTDLIDSITSFSDKMCIAEQLYRRGMLPKRICHCDTKVNNMLFDSENKEFLCIIDLDTVMPSFVFSDYGDFLRTAANTAPEDEPDISKIHFRMDIFNSFTQGYLESAKNFLTDIEIEYLPFAVSLFPYMQSVRFLTDYLNGDTYYKTSYPEHNKVRAYAQYELFRQVDNLKKELSDNITNIMSYRILN